MKTTNRSRITTMPKAATLVLVALSLLASACGGSDEADAAAATEPVRTEQAPAAEPDTEDDSAAEEPIEEAAEEVSEEVAEEPATPAGEGCPTIKLATHDSFVVSDDVLQTFTDETCIEVQLIAAGDAGQLVSSAILTKGNPTADVLFGIDNTFLQRGLDQDIFLAYESALLSKVDPALQLDPENRVTPIDYGDVCINYWTDALPGAEPTTLDDLIDPSNAGQLVTMNPETSSPGFAFLLATIAEYGDGWEDYWKALVDNDVSITSGWNDAYYGEFTAVGGDRSIVTSYASSPPAEVIFADPPVDAPPTAVLYDSCFRQIEFAGVLDGTEYPESAKALIDFMLSTTFQEDIPLSMFVYPVNGDAELPAEFVEFGQLADNPASLTPAEIEANREAWTERWVEIVLG